ncbi:CLUMA_CG014633, isoform A [Clunio marinus]|uniref:CLUMA_CG014633, isoform A n=1 Tax=Clunio marinus TaxID=568069 RepID=A0A1J1ILP5_9DIPT|nr:CLUMA_CG014633, isoform A [Clunio marinus]
MKCRQSIPDKVECLCSCPWFTVIQLITLQLVSRLSMPLRFLSRQCVKRCENNSIKTYCLDSGSVINV